MDSWQGQLAVGKGLRLDLGVLGEEGLVVGYTEEDGEAQSYT